MLHPGAELTLVIEKPAVGGRMIARAAGQVLLVDGAIPGERVRARVQRIGKGVAYAETVGVEERSDDRRQPFVDRACAGTSYAHIAYPRQLTIKALVVADAFARIARLPLPAPLSVSPSPEEGYRMRARLHRRGRRVGFFREGTHEICDARPTRQLLPATCDALERLAAALAPLNADVREIDLSENVEASERTVHLDLTPDEGPDLNALADAAGLTGLSAAGRVVAGRPYVTDTLHLGGHVLVFRRHTLAFFQGNRYLLGALVAHVADQVSPGSEVVDLYAGGGLFSVAAAALRRARVTAVEGDRVAWTDLSVNAARAPGAVTPVQQSVEAFAATTAVRPAVLLVDPPRTGMSREALEAAAGLGARRIVYVSCDVATLARDARRLADGGYTMARAEAFDLFPNTPHVETVAVFDRC